MHNGQILEYATLSEAAYARLREDILGGRWKPGDKLRLDTLRQTYGYGLSSLREALSKLSSERLVRSTGQRGYWVETISREEFEDITNLRLLLEPEALERSVANATAEWEKEFAETFSELQAVEQTLDTNREKLSAEWERKNRAFHSASVKNCGSEWMLRFVKALIEQSERYRRQAVRMHAIPKEVLQSEHEAIFDAALARNGRLAAELLRVHIRNSATALAAAIFDDGAAQPVEPPRRKSK